MVKIFLSGIGGSGKTTLLNDLKKEKAFKSYDSITEIARNIMRRKHITKEMIGADTGFHMQLQDEIVKDQRAEGEIVVFIASELTVYISELRLEKSDYISDRCVMDCFAVIKMRMSEEVLADFKRRHKVCSSVLLVVLM